MNENSVFERLLLDNNGYEVLLAIREIYYGNVRKIAEFDPAILEVLYKTEVIYDDQPNIDFTPRGYIIGSICKEYCNWLDNGRHMPQPTPPVEYYKDKVVLDLGCGIGRWLWEFEEAGKLVGIEMEKQHVDAAIVLSRNELKQSVNVINGSIEELQAFVEPNTIDFAFSRLVFNHVNINSTLAQTFDTLRKGGRLWLHVENYRFPVRTLLKERRIRSKVRALFSILNTLVYMAAGKQICLTIQGRMHESHKTVYPSSKTWGRILRSTGFQLDSTQRLYDGYIFVATK